MTAYPNDVDQHKTDLAERMIRAIQPKAKVTNIRHRLPHPEANAALQDVDLILGGLDNDAARLNLLDLASTHHVVYIDAASDIHTTSSPPEYGGRVVVAGTSPGCLFCLGLLDQRQIRHTTMTPDERASEAAIYGIPLDTLDTAGPSVVTLNGVIASVAATEAMVYLTGLRPPRKHLVYRADHGGVRLNLDSPTQPCPYCSRWPVAYASGSD